MNLREEEVEDHTMPTNGPNPTIEAVAMLGMVAASRTAAGAVNPKATTGGMENLTGITGTSASDRRLLVEVATTATMTTRNI